MSVAAPVEPVAMILLDGLFGLLLASFGWWLKTIAHDLQAARQAIADLKVKVAEEYATKELVDKMELRVVAALSEFKKDIKEELQQLFRHMESRN